MTEENCKTESGMNQDSNEREDQPLKYIHPPSVLSCGLLLPWLASDEGKSWAGPEQKGGHFFSDKSDLGSAWAAILWGHFHINSSVSCLATAIGAIGMIPIFTFLVLILTWLAFQHFCPKPHYSFSHTNWHPPHDLWPSSLLFPTMKQHSPNVPLWYKNVY